ncbi:MAG: RNA polymerase sigma factor, partial [candidate division Zixibacteria bacterium]|nr:RNA polymerase sigma factor [candidate division Zixibacteria bacterium]
DPIAFNRFVQMHSSRVYSIAYRIVGNADEAKDIAQEVFVRLYQSIHQYDSRYSFNSWVYRIAVNLSIDHHRREARHRKISSTNSQTESMPDNDSVRPDVDTERRELMGTIEQLTSDLSPSQRKVFVLRDLQGFGATEISSILKCSENTVRVHLSNARQKIKTALLEIYPDLNGDYTI